MGLYPIPWNVINDYGSVFEFNPEQLVDLHYFIRQLDEAWLKHYERKQKALQKEKKPIGKSRHPPVRPRR